MRLKIIISLSALILAGCATGSSGDGKESDWNLTGDDSSFDGDQLGGQSRTDSQRSQGSPTPVQATAGTETQALIEAVRSGSDDQIVRAATSILSKHPMDAKALNALGFVHYKRGQFAAAALMFDKAIKSDPRSSEVHNNMGLTFLAQKESREAIKSFRRALEANSGDGITAANLGALYIEHRDYNKALVAMEIAYRKNSKDHRILNNYGIALAATGKHSQARDMYKQALSLNSNSKDVMLNYAILLIDHLNKNDEGLDLIGKIRFLGPSPEARNRINALENKAKAALK
jgi:Flp pilus assembly protein TadD